MTRPTMTAFGEAVLEAMERGANFGYGRDFSESGPLSGEWAGESVNELLGDLLAPFEYIADWDAVAAICEAFEESAHHASERSR